MSNIILQGSASGAGTMTVVAPVTNTNQTLTLENTTGTLAPLVSRTAQATTSGTAFLFPNIPSWVKRITVVAYGISTNGTSSLAVKLGTASGIVSSGYFAMIGQIVANGTALASTNTTGFYLSASTAIMVAHATLVITLVDSANNYWVASGTAARDDSTDVMQYTGGGVALPETLTQLQITTVNGTDTFDAGTVNIMYE